MRGLAIVVINGLLVLGGCSAANTLLPYDPAGDAKKMQGTWKLTTAVYNGEQVMNDVHLTIDGDQYTIRLGGTTETSHFTLGTGGRNTIFVKHHDNPLASQGFYGGTLTGIYELSGDQFRVCYDLTGRKYPTGFDAGKSSRRAIFEYAREK